jgi:hypothetical protein
MGVETYFALAILVALALGVVFVIHGTMVKNKWGVNLRRVHCPNCGTVMGMVRMPTSGRQAMWGGFTCPSCKSELDKWGRQIAV